MKTRLGSLAGAIRRHSSALFLSGLSQAISSLTNFGILLYLVRVLDKAEFGLYSLGFAAYLVIAAILAAVFAVQYVVNAPDRLAHEHRTYALHHIIAMGLIGVLLVLIASILKWVISDDLEQHHNTLGLMLSVATAVLGFSVRDMVVRVCFVERRQWSVLWISTAMALATLLGFVAVRALSVTLNASIALDVVAFGQLAGAIFGLIFLGLPWQTFSRAGLRNAVTEAWVGGRWHGATSVVYSLRTQAHNFVITPILGLVVLAEINAARVLLTPAVMVIPPLYQFLMPRLAEMRGSNPKGLQRAVWITTVGLVGFALAYSFILILVLDMALPLTLGRNYADLGPVVVAWCAFTIFLAARNGLTMGMEIGKEFKGLLVVNVIAGVIAVAMAIVLSISMGGIGAVWALALAELVLCLLLGRQIARFFCKLHSTSMSNAGDRKRPEHTSNCQDEMASDSF